MEFVNLLSIGIIGAVGFKVFSSESIQIKPPSNLSNLDGGFITTELKSQIDAIISQDKAERKTKAYILAHVLKEIMNKCNIEQSEYMIIAGYCLKDIKEVGDLDVTVTPTAYEKLKSTGLFKVSVAKISKTERLRISFDLIDTDAEIEIFGIEPSKGFPSDDFSLLNLQERGGLIPDEFNNMYYGITTCIEQYSNLEKVDGKYIIFGKFEIDESRVRKNISHLEKIKDGHLDLTIKLLCEEKIDNLKKIL